MQLTDAISNAIVQSIDPAAAANREAMQSFLIVQKQKAMAEKGYAITGLSVQLNELTNLGFSKDSIAYQAIERVMKDLSTM